MSQRQSVASEAKALKTEDFPGFGGGGGNGGGGGGGHGSGDGRRGGIPYNRGGRTACVNLHSVTFCAGALCWDDQQTKEPRK